MWIVPLRGAPLKDWGVVSRARVVPPRSETASAALSSIQSDLMVRQRQTHDGTAIDRGAAMLARQVVPCYVALTARSDDHPSDWFRHWRVRRCAAELLAQRSMSRVSGDSRHVASRGRQPTLELSDGHLALCHSGQTSNPLPRNGLIATHFVGRISPRIDAAFPNAERHLLRVGRSFDRPDGCGERCPLARGIDWPRRRCDAVWPPESWRRRSLGWRDPPDCQPMNLAHPSEVVRGARRAHALVSPRADWSTRPPHADQPYAAPAPRAEHSPMPVTFGCRDFLVPPVGPKFDVVVNPRTAGGDHSDTAGGDTNRRGRGGIASDSTKTADHTLGDTPRDSCTKDKIRSTRSGRRSSPQSNSDSSLAAPTNGKRRSRHRPSPTANTANLADKPAGD